MKLREITNIVSSGDDTTLSGGKLPNAYTDNVNSVSKLPRTKKKDMYGGNGMKTSVDTGDGDAGNGDAGAAPSGGAPAGGGDGGGGGAAGGGAGGGGAGGGA